MSDRRNWLRERIAAVSPQWQGVLKAESTRENPDSGGDVAGQIRDERTGRGVEAIYEGYALHYATAREVSVDASGDLKLLIGDYCYAAGLCEVADAGDIRAVRRLADLISTVATTDTDEHGPAWQTTLKELR